MGDARSGVKILVVDDEKLIRMTLSAKLMRIGYTPVAVGDVDSAVKELKAAPKSFGAVITDIMMDNMDGFDFRDFVRGLDPMLPMFFLTALDPEEGSGFLKRILEDPISYYLPKAVKTDVLLKRVQQVVASRRVERFIMEKIADDRKALELAAHIQRSMLPVRAIMTPRGFYTTWWRPADIVSGDLYEAVPFGTGTYLYVLGDIQGHGTSAALAMTAVQSFLKNMRRIDGNAYLSPETIANMLQKFFRTNLANVSYMTALICVHAPLRGEVRWLACGAPELVVLEDGKPLAVNPEKRGGLPIGLLPDTVYTEADVVVTPLSMRATCIAFTDGLFELSRGSEGAEQVPMELSHKIRDALEETSRRDGSVMSAPHRYMSTLAELGYSECQDDMTLLVFGGRIFPEGIYEATIPLTPDDIDYLANDIAQWCAEKGWPEDLVGKVQLVLEEKVMNVYDHGFDERYRMHEVVNVRLRRWKDGGAELVVWDTGTPEPTLQVAAGDAATAFEMANNKMSNHGRGRLMVRELCSGIERNRYGTLNETIYYVRESIEGQNERTLK